MADEDKLEFKRGDYGFYINFTVKDCAEPPVAYDITGYTVKFRMWKEGTPGLIASGTCAHIVSADGTCKYLVLAGDFAHKGLYNWELELTKAGTRMATQTYELNVIESH